MDRTERVIKGLEACLKRLNGESCHMLDCPYKDRLVSCEDDLLEDALITARLYRIKTRKGEGVMSMTEVTKTCNYCEYNRQECDKDYCGIDPKDAKWKCVNPEATDMEKRGKKIPCEHWELWDALKDVVVTV